MGLLLGFGHNTLPWASSSSSSQESRQSRYVRCDTISSLVASDWIVCPAHDKESHRSGSIEQVDVIIIAHGHHSSYYIYKLPLWSSSTNGGPCLLLSVCRINRKQLLQLLRSCFCCPSSSGQCLPKRTVRNTQSPRRRSLFRFMLMFAAVCMLIHPLIQSQWPNMDPNPFFATCYIV